MKPKVYLETTVASYLTARPSRDLVVARGDQDAAARRVAEMDEIPILELSEEARDLAREFASRGLVPEKVAEDAFHIAIATAQGMDFLLTWNCLHIANAEIMERLEAVCLERGYTMPALCVPEQLMGS